MTLLFWSDCDFISFYLTDRKRPLWDNFCFGFYESLVSYINNCFAVALSCLWRQITIIESLFGAGVLKPTLDATLLMCFFKGLLQTELPADSSGFTTSTLHV
jgi:hypothetical protein